MFEKETTGKADTPLPNLAFFKMRKPERVKGCGARAAEFAFCELAVLFEKITNLGEEQLLGRWRRRRCGSFLLGRKGLGSGEIGRASCRERVLMPV